jgi:hypothetical protein
MLRPYRPAGIEYKLNSSSSRTGKGIREVFAGRTSQKDHVRFW